MKVLFIDDEVKVLEAIERVLFDANHDWEPSFVDNGNRALEQLQREHFDVVVTDLLMPGADGAAVLKRVKQLSPGTVRIVLSGHNDEESALDVVCVAHQFLAKPCPAETVCEVIARTQRLRAMLVDKKLQALVGRIEALAVAPSLLREAIQLLDSEHGSSCAERLVGVVQQDPGMTSKLLQVASSAFFNNSASVSDVQGAIMRLGLRTVRNLLATLEAEEHAFHGTDDLVEQQQRRSLRIARLASSMARLPEDASAAYVAGLLCDAGRLVFTSAAPERLYASEAEAAQHGVPHHLAEQATWGVTHAEIGAYLLGLWGLPTQIVEAVANHHAPERDAGARLGLTQLLWLASCIVDREQPNQDSLLRFGATGLYAKLSEAEEALQ